jgi:flagellar export protein FliJ
LANSFKFRFEKILGVRRLKEDLAEREFAFAVKALREQDRTIAQLRAEAEEGLEALRGLRRNSIDLVQIGRQEAYLLGLERRLQEAAGRLRELSRIESEKRAALTGARQAVEVLEKHRERRLQAHVRESEREERKVLDEVAQNVARRES